MTRSRMALLLVALVGVGSLTLAASLASRRRTAPPPSVAMEASAPASARPAAPGQPPAAPAAAPAARPAPDQPAPRGNAAPAPAVARATQPAARTATPTIAAGPWPQWRGPDRTGISHEAGLLKTWPAEGPPAVWKTTGLGGGYATPSVAGGRIYGMGKRAAQAAEEEVVWALDEKTGKEVWSTALGPSSATIGYGEGPRCTPTVDGNRLYVLGVGGDLACLDTAGGKVIWRKNLVTEFGGSVPRWGYSESPLVDGEKLVVAPGGAAATVVALNKQNGEVIWKSQVPGGPTAHYSSPIAADVHGVRQYLYLLSGGGVGVAANDGKFLWKYDRHANLTANIATPIHRDGHVLFAVAYGSGAGLVKLDKATDGSWTATEVYFNPEMKNKHGGMVLVGDHVYGFDDPGTLTCMEFKTGKTVWRDRSVSGNAAVTFADGNLYCRSQRGTMGLVVATPEGYQERGRFEQSDRTNQSAWPHPVIANGKLLLRDQDVMLCYDLKKAPGAP